MAITKKTTDEEIIMAFKDEEHVITRFDHIRKIANSADAERDRLRDYINKHIKRGTYGKATLDFSQPQTRFFANSDGLNILKHGRIAKVINERQFIEFNEEYKLYNKDGHVVATIEFIPNDKLYTRSESCVIKTIVGA